MLEYLRLLPGGSDSANSGVAHVPLAAIGVVVAVIVVVSLVFRRR